MNNTCAQHDGERSEAGNKTVLFSHLYIYMIILPRQTRDKHRGKRTVFPQGIAESGAAAGRNEEALREKLTAMQATATVRSRRPPFFFSLSVFPV